MTTFNWQIVSLLAYPQAEGETDVVFQVNWSCQAQENGYDSKIIGAVHVTYLAGTSFTPYTQLTETQIWDWINPSIDKPEIELNLQQLIDSQKNPQIITPPLPWIQQGATNV
jgi:hypothetical protein